MRIYNSMSMINYWKVNGMVGLGKYIGISNEN